MTMYEPTNARTGAELVTWLDEQVAALKAQLGRLQQQGEQTQAALLDLNESVRDGETKLRDLTSRTIGVPAMQEQVRALSGLLERIQDAEVTIDTKFELLERGLHDERGRDQGEKNDLFRRVQDLERRSEALFERQSSVDDVHRRFQEEVSKAHIHEQTVNQRLEGVESKAGRTLDAVVRLEQVSTEAEAAIRGLRREDDVLAERARLAHEIAARLETEMHTTKEEYRELPLLAERVELLRAERQRLEDRVSRSEEALDDATSRLARQEEFASQLDTRVKAHDARIDHVHGATLDFRRTQAEQLLKLNQMLERMKRRQVEELERDVKELRVQSNHLKNDDNDF